MCYVYSLKGKKLLDVMTKGKRQLGALIKQTMSAIPASKPQEQMRKVQRKKATA